MISHRWQFDLNLAWSLNRQLDQSLELIRFIALKLFNVVQLSREPIILDVKIKINIERWEDIYVYNLRDAEVHHLWLTLISWLIHLHSTIGYMHFKCLRPFEELTHKESCEFLLLWSESRQRNKLLRRHRNHILQVSDEGILIRDKRLTGLVKFVITRIISVIC